MSYKRYKEKMKTKNKKNYLKQNGITLIALVVTIVVLLILAGVEREREREREPQH